MVYIQEKGYRDMGAYRMIQIKLIYCNFQTKFEET